MRGGALHGCSTRYTGSPSYTASYTAVPRGTRENLAMRYAVHGGGFQHSGNYPMVFQHSGARDFDLGGGFQHSGIR